MSKTIPIPVQVPDWAKWVAQDSNGNWHAYQNQPKAMIDEWESNGSVWLMALGHEDNPNWRETLREVE